MNELKPEDVMKALERFALDLGATRRCDALVLVEKVRTIICEKDAEIERLEDLNSKLLEKCSKVRAEAIDEFADRLKAKLIAGGIYPVFVKKSIEKIAKEMKGN